MRSVGVPCFAVACALLLTGCPTPPPPSQFPSADDALGRMKASYACANGIQGEGKLDHLSPHGRVRGDVLIFAINPARVRFDVVSPFGALLYTLTSNGESFEMLDVGQKQFLVGPASACNLARLTQVPVPGHVLVSLLRGEAPLLVHQAADARIAWDSGGFYRIEVESKHQARQEVDLEVVAADWQLPWREQRVRVRAIVTMQQDAVLWDAEFDDFELAHTAPPRQDPDGLDDDIPPSGPACDVELPRKIRLRVPHAEDDVLFEYRNVAFNPPIPEGAFSQPMPRGVRRVEVDCQDR